MEDNQLRLVEVMEQENSRREGSHHHHDGSHHHHHHGEHRSHRDGEHHHHSHREGEQSAEHRSHREGEHSGEHRHHHSSHRHHHSHHHEEHHSYRDYGTVRLGTLEEGADADSAQQEPTAPRHRAGPWEFYDKYGPVLNRRYVSRDRGKTTRVLLIALVVALVILAGVFGLLFAGGSREEGLEPPQVDTVPVVTLDLG